MAAEESTSTRVLRVEMTDKDWNEFRGRALMEGMTIGELATLAVAEKLAQLRPAEPRKRRGSR